MPSPALFSSRAWGAWLGLLTLLFAGRVVGQAIQCWAPQAFLPPFGAFQGSNLPYWILLPAQIVILGLMARASWQAGRGTFRPTPAVARLLAWGGAVYLLGALARIAVGLTVPSAHVWFRTWIPAVFHVVLAAFVISLAVCAGRRRELKPET